MIRLLLRVLGAEYARPVRRTLALMTAASVAEGLSYAFLLPILAALLGDNPTEAWPWLAGFAAALAAYAVLRFVSDLSGFRVGASLLQGVYHRLGDHLATLPIGWYDTGRVGEVSTLASRGVLQAMRVIAHLLTPFVSSCVTPLTIVAVILFHDWRMGLAALVAVPLVALVQAGTSRAQSDADAERSGREIDATDRVVEFLQSQPVLRAGGWSGRRFGMLDDSLQGLERTSRRTTLSTMPGVLGLAVTVQAVFTAILGLGAYLATGGDPGAVELVALLVLAARCADPLLSLAEIGGQLRSVQPSWLGWTPCCRRNPCPSQSIRRTRSAMIWPSTASPSAAAETP